MLEKHLCFIESVRDIKVDKSTYIVSLKSNIISKEDLLNEYYEKMKFPEYFGFNWDALWDFLKYLDWIKQKNIIIYHSKLPSLEIKEMKIYLNILIQTTAYWNKYEEHFFNVYFNRNDYDMIHKIMKHL